MGFVKRMDQNVAKHRIGIQMKMKVRISLNGTNFSSGCVGIIVLTKIKAMSLCLFWLFEEMLSMQFFWNIQRKENYHQAI